MADAHRARRCLLALAVILQAQEFPAGNPAAAAGSVAKAGDGEIGRKGPKGERDASETAGRFSGKSTWMGGYSVAVLKLILEQSPPLHPHLPILLCIRRTPPAVNIDPKYKFKSIKIFFIKI